MSLKIVVLQIPQAHLSGATLGEEHRNEVFLRFTPQFPDIALVFDMRNVVSVTASYLKAALLPSLRPSSPSTPAEPSPTEFASAEYSVFPFVANCTKDVATDIHEFFLGRKLPIAHLDDWNDHSLSTGRLMGFLDPVLFRTLSGVSELKECTAADLAGRSPETITVNGWSNRLADLYQLRLVARRREGKFWFYSPVIERILLWA